MHDVSPIFGKVTPPVSGIGANPSGDLTKLIAGGINFFLVFMGILGLIYMMWGAVSWVTSGGEKDKLQKAQARIRSAVVGIFLAVVVLVLFNTIYGLALPNSGIITPINGGFKFTIPSFR